MIDFTGPHADIRPPSPAHLAWRRGLADRQSTAGGPVPPGGSRHRNKADRGTPSHDLPACDHPGFRRLTRAVLDLPSADEPTAATSPRDDGRAATRHRGPTEHDPFDPTPALMAWNVVLRTLVTIGKTAEAQRLLQRMCHRTPFVVRYRPEPSDAPVDPADAAHPAVPWDN